MKENKIAVVKVGGDILLDLEQKQGLVRNVKSLIDSGWQVVVIHGGGPQVSQLQKQLGISINKIDGRRVTSTHDLRAIKQAIAGEVNVDLVSALLSHGVEAFGFHGASGSLLTASKRPQLFIPSEGKEVDFGEVGQIEGVNTGLLQHILQANVVPVIATLSAGREGEIYNINADTSATHIAEAISADILFMVTEVGGIYSDINDKDSLISTINSKKATELIDSNIIRDGMIPKVQEAFRILDQGVNKVVILSSKKQYAFLSVVKGKGQFGTTIKL